MVSFDVFTSLCILRRSGSTSLMSLSDAEETGNFQGTGNPGSPQSVAAGEGINNFFNAEAAGAQHTILQGFSELERCQNQAVMCCFGRDRQSNDNNGNCADGNCGDADPGDNSNLCYTSQANKYPEETEGAIHCHGFAWPDDATSAEARLRFNNFFFVSMYDHMYTRGYVGRSVANNDVFPMCGCIEEMPPVSRSDCTQTDVNTKNFKFVIRRAKGDTLSISYVADTGSFDIDFNACEGIDRDNDLHEYVERLVSEGRFSTETRDEIQKVLVGHEDPNNNNNEDGCRESYEGKYGAGTYANRLRRK